jgi:hypothetical protein
METFSFGFPPNGKSAILSNRKEPMPEKFRFAIAAQHEADHPHGYITAAVDCDLGLVGLYHRTAQSWIHLDRVSEVVLQPTLPAKGSGMIEICWESERNQYPGGCIYATGYTERIHAWFAERAQRLSAIIGCPYREAEAWTDC